MSRFFSTGRFFPLRSGVKAADDAFRPLSVADASHASKRGTRHRDSAPSRLTRGLVVCGLVLGGAFALGALAKPSLAVKIGGDVFLQGDFTEVGIHPSGSFGTVGPAPAGFHPGGALSTSSSGGRQLGFVSDIGADGWTVGTFNPDGSIKTPAQSGDYFIPGAPEEGWSVEWNGAGGAERQFVNHGLSNKFDVPQTSLTDTSSGATRSSVWQGTAIPATTSAEQLRITQTVTFQRGDQFFVISASLTNVGSTTLKSLEYMRNVDPDQEQDLTGNFTTSNFVVTPSGAKVARANGLKYGVPLGLGTLDPRAVVSVEGFSNYDPDAIIDSPVTYPQSMPHVFDEAIAVAIRFGDVAPGQTVTFNYAYVLNESQLFTALGRLGNVTILQPTGTISGSSVQFQATTDRVPTTSKIEFFVNGTSIGTDTTPTTDGVFDKSFDSTAFANGTLTLRVLATFSDGSVGEQTSTVTVDNSGPPIKFDAPTAGTSFVGDNIPIQVSATNSARPVARVSFFRELADGTSLFLGEDTSAPFTSKFNTSDLSVGDTVTLKAVATDSLGRAFTVQLVGTVGKANSAPSIANIAVSTPEDTAFTFSAALFDAKFTDADSGDSLQSVRVVSLPANGTLKLSGAAVTVGKVIARASLGALTFTPAADFNGSTSFKYNASDGTVFAASDATVNISVTAVNDAPTISDIADQTVAQNASTGAISFAVGDIDNAPTSLTLSATSSNTALVPVSAISFGGVGANRTITVTPLAGKNGTATITVTVSDGSLSASDSFVLTVTAPVNRPPVLNDASFSGTVGTLFSAQLLATDADSDTLTYSVLSGTLPGGLSLSTSGLISGTPTAAGNFTATVKVSDGAASDTAKISIAIAPLPVPSGAFIVDRQTLSAAVGRAFSYPLTAIGDPGATFTWSVAPGSSLPAGVTLSSVGVLGGTPGSVGTFFFSLRTSNGTDIVTTPYIFIVMDRVDGVGPVVTRSAVPTPTTRDALAALTLTGTVRDVAPDGVTPSGVKRMFVQLRRGERRESLQRQSLHFQGNAGLLPGDDQRGDLRSGGHAHLEPQTVVPARSDTGRLPAQHSGAGQSR